MKQKKKPSVNRVVARKAEKVLNPAIKKVAESVHKTGKVPEDFLGYKAAAGTFEIMGRTWQYQISAVCTKKDIMKSDGEPITLTRKWAIGVRLRAIAKHIVDTIFENK